MQPYSPPHREVPKSFHTFLSHFEVSSLPEIRWFHRVNKHARLRRFLASDAHVAEGDIMMGPNNTSVMRHPFSIVKDHTLPFSEWIDLILEDEKKGAKLDLKELGAAEHALGYLKKIVTEKNAHRIFISVDILKGPFGAEPAFSPSFLHQIRKEFPKIILSLGHTTKYSKNARSGYTEKMIEEMHEITQTLSPPITVALRAELLLHSKKEAVQKLFNNPETTLTIWSGRDTYVGKRDWPNLFLKQYGERAFIDLVNQKLDPIHITQWDL